MTKCHCGKEKYPPNVKTSWMWGGCSDNGKHGKRMAKRFLDLHPSDGDQVSEILRHNSEVFNNILNYVMPILPLSPRLSPWMCRANREFYSLIVHEFGLDFHQTVVGRVRTK